MLAGAGNEKEDRGDDRKHRATGQPKKPGLEHSLRAIIARGDKHCLSIAQEFPYFVVRAKEQECRLLLLEVEDAREQDRPAVPKHHSEVSAVPFPYARADSPRRGRVRAVISAGPRFIASQIAAAAPEAIRQRNDQPRRADSFFRK